MPMCTFQNQDKLSRKSSSAECSSVATNDPVSHSIWHRSRGRVEFFAAVLLSAALTATAATPQLLPIDEASNAT